jgi:hypothetical protein
MKARILLLFAVFSGLFAGDGGAATPLFVDATPADNFKVYWLVRADSAPVIDGKPDEPVWQKAKPLDGWGITNYGRQKGTLGEIDFRALWDDSYLYVSAKCFHRRNPKDMEELKRQVSNLSAEIYSRECLEIHIDGNLDHATRFQSIVNPLSEKWMCWYYDFGWGLLENVDYGLDADWDVAASIEKDYWAVEVRYALSDIQVQPRVGTMFGINPCWFNWADTREEAPTYWWQFMTWSTHGDSHHDPRLYGRFILVKDEPKSLEEGLRLAFPDLDKRSVMIQTDQGYLVFRQGKQSLESYDVRVLNELKAAQTRLSEVSDALAKNKITHGKDYFEKLLKDSEESLSKTQKELLERKGALNLGQLQGNRNEVAKAFEQLDDLYWRVRQDALLTSLERGR